MNRYLYGKFKFTLLIIVVSLSLLQVGILWNYQNQGLPIGFFNVGNYAESTQKNYDPSYFFRPSRIIISNGFDEPHVVCNPGQVLFENLWKEASLYIRDIIVENKILSSKNYTDQEWSEIAVKKSILMNFPVSYDAKLLKLLLGIEGELNLDFETLYKACIVFENDLNSEIIVFITDGKKICQYNIRPHEKAGAFSNYNEQTQTNDIENQVEQSAKLILEIFPRRNEAPIIARPDIPVYVEGDNYEKHNTISVALPNWVKSPQNDWDNMEFSAKKVLGSDKESYDYDIDSEGVLTFVNINSIYRLDSLGNLYYNYIGNQKDNTNIDINESFEEVLSFVDSRKNFLEMSNIYLCKINYDEKKGVYVFGFNYTINNIPVIISGDKDGVAEPSIIIEANNSRVVSAQITIREFASTNAGLFYDLSLKDFSTGIFSKFSGSELKKISMEDFFVAYFLDEKTKDKNINPYWVIKTDKGKYYGVNLSRKEESDFELD